MKTVTIFFGEMGCGKSFCALAYAKRHGFKFFEGDNVVTARMLSKVKSFKPIPLDALKEYVEVLAQAIDDQAQNCDNLIVAQALYLDNHRQYIRLFLEEHGYQVRFWLVKTHWWRNVRNLLSRPQGWKWVYYWLMNKPFFETPTHKYKVYPNLYGG